METSLDCLRPGKRAVVLRVNTDAALGRRLYRFGLTPGAVVSCRYRSPWGSLTALRLGSTVLVLNTRDLRKIRVRC